MSFLYNTFLNLSNSDILVQSHVMLSPREALLETTNNNVPRPSSTRIWPSSLRATAPALLLLTACLLPYLNKAFTVDDPWFLAQAQQILREPLRPTAFEICWFGQTCGPAWQIGARQALWGYFLAPVAAMGSHEWLAHGLQIALAAITVLFTVALCLRMGWHRREATFAALILVAMPPFLPMASTAMPDTLALCLAAIGLERLIAWKVERRWAQALAAGLALGLAPHARAHLALLLPIGAVLLLDDLSLDGIKRSFRPFGLRWLPILVAGAVFVAFFVLTREPGSGFAPPAGQVQFKFWRQNLLSYFEYLVFPLPVAAAAIVANRRKRLVWVGVLLAACGAGVFGMLGRHMPFGASGGRLILAGTGAVALVSLFVNSIRLRDLRSLCWALMILIPFSAVPYFQLPIRYFLFALPAIVLILLDVSRTLPIRAAVAGAVLLIAAGTSFSAGILWVDAKFAESNRTAAEKLIAPRVAAGQKVWFCSQWGFYWYAQRAGAVFARPAGEAPAPGDLLAVDMTSGGNLTGGHAALARFPKRTLVEQVSYPSNWGTTVGLYSNVMSSELWSWGQDRTGRYELWRID
jgi:hypothetical protein